jgi:hypothetical protein
MPVLDVSCIACACLQNKVQAVKIICCSGTCKQMWKQKQAGLSLGSQV